MKKLIYLGCLVLFLFSFSYSFEINFVGLGDLFKRKVVGVHFNAAGNDFGGMFFVTKLENILSDPGEVSNGITLKTNCEEQLKGFYYNSQHGQIMYPLDKDTMEYWRNINSNYYSGLDLSGAIYTSCNGDNDSIFGQVKWFKNGVEMFSLQAGFQYNYTGNSIDFTSFADNLQTIYTGGTTNIVGLLYDSSYGIGFVGGKINSGFVDIVDAMNLYPVKDIIINLGYKIFNTEGADIDAIYGIGLDTNLAVKGLIGLGSDMYNKTNILKRFMDITRLKNDTIVMKGNLLNVGVYINKIRKNSAEICNGNRNNGSMSQISSGGGTVCIKTDNSDIFIDRDITLNGEETNIIIKGKRNKLIIKKSQEGPGYINVFVDNGYVLFDNNIDLLSINGYGEIDDNTGITSGAVFNGNIYVNGLIAGWDQSINTISDFTHKMYIYGSVGSLNSVGENMAREIYVNNLLGIEIKDLIDVTSSFSWQCMGVTGTDIISCGDPNDLYGFNSLIVKDRKYQNILLR